MSLREIEPLWSIVEGRFSEESNKHFEGMFTQGNGYMSIRGCLEEFENDNGNFKYGTYVPGIVGKHPVLNEEIINLPWFFDCELDINGERLSILESSLSDYQRWLDLRDGVLHRKFKWSCKDGTILSVSMERFVNMEMKNMCLERTSIKVLAGRGKIGVIAGINADLTTNGYNHFEKVETFAIEDQSISLKTVTDQGDVILQASCIKSTVSFEWENIINSLSISMKGQRNFEEEDSIEFVRINALTTSRDMDKSKPQVGRLLENLHKCTESSYEELYEGHADIWKEKWKFSDVKITGDDDAQLALRFSIYHLIRSDAENDPRVQICAKGYAGEGYCGRFFWDTEIYLLPFFIHTNQAAARNLLKFRYLTLDSARQIAASYNYKGARYPWEASINGDEQCPSRSHAENQVHVTADIVYAIWQYYTATGDINFMIEAGAEILLETSRFWAGRVDIDPEGNYNILGVIGPDEYKPFVMNNAYTNRMVQFNLLKTVEFLKSFKEVQPDEYILFTRRLKLDPQEIIDFEEIADKIKIPYDHEKGFHLQCDDFGRYADIDFNEIWKDRTKFFHKFVSWEKIFRSKALKQADVILMYYLFPDDFSEDTKLKAYHYYEPITVHDSSLSSVVHSIITSRLGVYDEAYRFFNIAAAIDMSDRNGGASEGIHIANCGGLWQLVVFGFAGIKSSIWEKKIKLEPRLPKQWEGLEFTMLWKGERYRIMITKNDSKVEKISTELFETQNRSVPETQNGKTEVKAVVFDLDGVIVDTAKYHYKAWKYVADKENIYFDEKINERLKGVSRNESLNIIMERRNRDYNIEELKAIAKRKNDLYVDMLGNITPDDMLPGMKDFIKELKDNGIKIAIFSASKNTDYILDKLGIKEDFDVIMTGNDVIKTKPDPEGFVKSAQRLGVGCENCVMIEDSFAGIQGAKDSNMKTLGVGKRTDLFNADYVLASTEELNLEKIKMLF